MEQTTAAAAERLVAFMAWLYNPVNQMLLAPLLGCLLICAIRPHYTRAIKTVAVIASGISLLCSVLLVTGLPEGLRKAYAFLADYAAFNPNLGQDFNSNLQFTNKFTWMTFRHSQFQGFGVEYFVGIDGLSLPLVIMSAAVIFLAVIWSLNRTERVRDYFALLLLMTVGLLGVFVALDYVLFYLFWELMLIPMYFLISGWGKRRDEAAKAAIRFFVYTLFGSVFLLIAFIAIQNFSSSANIFTFSIPDCNAYMRNIGINLIPQVRLLMFLGLLVAFAVKAPMFPLHTWLPPAHTQAPVEMSVILAAVMLKSGTYAFLRVLYWNFPDVGYSIGPILATLAVAGIVWGAAVTLVQTDIKRMIAYSSISHMGFIILGAAAMNPLATTGAIYHMVGHGVIITTLFLLADAIERRYGTRDIHEIIGLAKAAPFVAGMLSLSAFAAMGFPALAGFWGELYSLLGAFENGPVWQTVMVGNIDGSRYLQILAAVAVLGVLGSAVYMISLLQRLLPGEPPERAVVRLRFTEVVVLLPLGLMIVFLGVYPNALVRMTAGYAALLDYYHSSGQY